MAKLFNGKVGFGFAFNQTGAQPLDDRSVVQSYAELLKAETFGTAIYNGMIVATVDEQKVYMLVDKTKVTAADGWKEVGAGGAVSVETYAEAVALATDENIGQVIYVKTESSYDADGEGEGAAIEYDAAPYIVIGTGSLQKLAASTASGDIEGDVAELKTKVSGLETTVGDAKGGLVKDVAELESAIDLKADASNVYAKSETYTQSEVNNLLANIPEVPFQSVAEGDKVLALNGGVLSSTLSYAREEVEDVDSLVLKGIDGAVIGSVPVADFIADGMLESVTPVEGTNKFKFTFKKVDGSTEDFEVDFGKFVDTYHADGTTLELDSTTNTFKVKDGVFDASGAAAQALADAQTYVDGSIGTVNAKIDTKLNIATFEMYKTTNDAAVAKKVEQSAYDLEVTALKNAINTKADADALNSYATIKSVDTSLALKADIASIVKSVSLNGVDGTFADNKVALTIDLSGYADKDAFEALVKKVGHEATGDASATGLVADIASLRADLSTNTASIEALTEGLAAKLNASAKVNGVSFADDEAILDAGDIALAEAITRTGEDGGVENVYGAETSIQSVLANLSQRIDVLDPNVSGELGITSIVGGNGIGVTTSGGQATISVKASDVEGNIAEVKTDGIYVAVPDMRSYWEDI